ncbi:uncharacterized protein EAE97_002351 [Botrytis byssoidea]|uniref:BHLH domain-containing protein n=1 Tax=Botrytis byssoidea TaxID=139641 RepID=A0A9P5IVA6_9HELO|nr:uncharacterized protein EAE97_002351 [Botrytis byssoidea]KAF7950799.1 hypothetical protein EAE97_002351 [Botrytis byssoidea]
MPRPAHPPTPASSTEIKGKDGSNYSSLQMSFELPPPAVAGVESRPTSSSTQASSASYQPASPISPAIPASEAVKLRRRTAAQTTAKDSFALPPPPTRSRKIIQMKPRGQSDEIMDTPAENTKSGGKPTSNTPKKKQPSSTSVAGRKIARKTAHSLIERRRRSKMNEEFGVLKDMIPACTGEMHKLAILQASIDYVRYLEDCVSKLKAENARGNFSTNTGEFTLPPSAHRGSYDPSRHEHSTRETEEDIEMAGSENPSTNYTTPTPPSQQTSPAMLPQDSRQRQDSYSSYSTDSRHYSLSTSSTTSPALGSSVYDYARSIASVGSALTSPALIPQRDQRDIDEEASAALLMLNSDRRGTSFSGVRGMSVKDLLSS